MFGTDNRLTPDEEEIKILSTGGMNDENRMILEEKTVGKFISNDLMDLSTLGLLIEDESLLDTESSSYIAYLLPETEESSKQEYRIIVEDGKKGLEAVCNLNLTTRLFPDKDVLDMEVSNIPEYVKNKLNDSSITILTISRILESAWRSTGKKGDLATLVSVMNEKFGIPHINGYDFNSLMNSIDTFVVNENTIPALEYLTAYTYSKKVEELLDNGTIQINEGESILEGLIEKFVLPEVVTAGVLRDLYKNDKYKEIVKSAVMNKSGEYNKVLELL